jgi:hypothetical protein
MRPSLRARDMAAPLRAKRVARKVLRKHRHSRRRCRLCCTRGSLPPLRACTGRAGAIACRSHRRVRRQWTRATRPARAASIRDDAAAALVCAGWTHQHAGMHACSCRGRVANARYHAGVDTAGVAAVCACARGSLPPLGTQRATTLRIRGRGSNAHHARSLSLVTRDAGVQPARLIVRPAAARRRRCTARTT